MDGEGPRPGHEVGEAAQEATTPLRGVELLTQGAEEARGAMRQPGHARQRPFRAQGSGVG